MAVTGVHHGSQYGVTPFRLSLEAAGLGIVLVGAWAGIVPFVGPIFGFSADGSASWHWNLAHALLSFAPGVGAVVAGLIVLAGTIARSSGHRWLVVAGPLAALCGAWFVIGPVAWPVLEGVNFLRSATPTTAFEYWIGYFLGTGALLLALGAFIFGELRRAQLLTTSVGTTT